MPDFGIILQDHEKIMQGFVRRYKILHDFGMSCKILQDLVKILLKIFCWAVTYLLYIESESYL